MRVETKSDKILAKFKHEKKSGITISVFQNSKGYSYSIGKSYKKGEEWINNNFGLFEDELLALGDLIKEVFGGKIEPKQVSLSAPKKNARVDDDIPF